MSHREAILSTLDRASETLAAAPTNAPADWTFGGSKGREYYSARLLDGFQSLHLRRGIAEDATQQLLEAEELPKEFESQRHHLLRSGRGKPAQLPIRRNCITACGTRQRELVEDMLLQPGVTALRPWCT